MKLSEDLRRLLVWVVVASLVGLPPGPAPALAEKEETFNFSDASVSVPVALQETAKANALEVRRAPVSAAGSFTWSLPIDVPPGRLGMTPQLALSYSSVAAKGSSPVGAGWSLGTPRIVRSTKQGFPPLKAAAGRPVYDDEATVFDGPSGELAAATDGPGGAQGKLYAPLREYNATRFEYFAPAGPADCGGRWTEHLPDGRKRLYGEAKGYHARICNEPGTYAWLLVEERDADGNYISYTYHNSPEQSRNDKKVAQAAPLLESIKWGGNDSQNLAHIFSLQVTLGPQEGDLDLMHGNVVLKHRIERIDVRQAATYWSYEFSYRTSRDTDRLLLGEVTRTAPNEQPRTTRFTYTSNDQPGLVPFLGPKPLPGNTAAPANFEQAYAQLLKLITSPEDRAVSTPTGRRSGYKFFDFDGDGRTDILYHPAGLQTTSSQIRYDHTFLQGGRGGQVSWTNPTVGIQGGWPVSSLGLADVLISDLADLDGDFDLDGVSFPVEVRGVGSGEANPRVGFVYLVDSTSYCCNSGFWNACGFVDPLPPDWSRYRRELDRAVQLESWHLANENASWTLPSRWGSLWPTLTGSLDFRDARFWTDLGRELPTTDSGQRPNLPAATIHDRGLLDCLSMVKQCYFQGPQCATPVGSVNWRELVPQGSGVVEEALSGEVIHTYVNRSHQPDLPFDSKHFLPGWPSHVKQRVWVIRDSDPRPGGGYNYHAEVKSDFMAPLVDLNGDGRSDLVLLKYLDTSAAQYKFVPRAYVNSGITFETDTGIYPKPASRFNKSLLELLTDGRDECIEDGSGRCTRDALFPIGYNFSSFFADVNADGLPDLVAATPPTNPGLQDGTQFRICKDGHQVFLNRGYAFQQRSETVLPGEYWSSPASVDYFAHPLRLLENRDKSCGYVSVLLDELVPDRPVVPMSAASFTDLNADGRVDMVAAFLRGGGPEQHYIFLNDGRGFRRPSQSFAPNFARGLVGLDGTRLPIKLALVPPQRTSLFEVKPDWARFVDLNNDGLVDIIEPGFCSQETGACRPAQWYENAGVIPDLLTKVEDHGGGWTSVRYVAATSPQARQLGVIGAQVGQLRSGQIVACEIRQAAGPAGPSFPVQTIRSSYENFVRDLAANDPIGFEKVTAVFTNDPPQTVRVTRTYDVRKSLPGIGVRYPLRGAVQSTLTESGADSVRAEARYMTGPLGAGVRIRSQSLHRQECYGGTCTWTGQETLAWDAYGNPTESRSGNSDGTALSADSELVRAVMTYQNYTDSVWKIGLVTARETTGYSEDLSGAGSRERLLRRDTWTYDGSGRLARAARRGITPAQCASTAGGSDDVTTYGYSALGLVTRIGRNRRMTLALSYDPARLHVSRQEVQVSKYDLGGRVVGRTTLRETYQPDYRHGQPEVVTDFNGFQRTNRYDSLGRVTEEYGPSGELLASHVYRDAYPASRTSTIYTDAGRSFQRRTHFDGEGRVRGVVELAEGSYVRKASYSHDAFGRLMKSFLPARAANLDDITPGQAEAPEARSYDGFDRVSSVTRPDGHTTTFGYSGRTWTETNPRGFKTERTFDGRGELVRVRRYGTGNVLVSEHSLTRDGLGRVIRVNDGDGNVRGLERDGAGRIAALTLPHAASAAPASVGMCYCLEDHPASITTPLGTIQVARDEVGRPVRITATAGSVTEETFRSHDDRASRGLGKLWQVSDKSGVHELAYDSFGRPRLVAYAPSAAVLADTANVARRYAAIFDYNYAGDPRSITFQGLPGAASLNYVRDAKGRVTRLSSDAPSGQAVLVTWTRYDERDRLTGAVFGNQSAAEWKYNALTQWLEQITYGGGSPGDFRAVLAYKYDQNGNPSEEFRARVGAMLPVKNHAYDALDRLESSQVSYPLGPSRTETYRYTPGGNIGNAAGEAYTYGDPTQAQAVTRVDNPGGDTRSLAYNAVGQLVSDVMTYRQGARRDRTLTYSPMGCLESVEAKHYGSGGGLSSHTRTSFICGRDGSRVVRQSQELPGGGIAKRIDFAGLAEIRTDEGIFLLRIKLGDTTLVEEARALATGGRVPEQSGYVHGDLRGSVVTQTAFNAPDPRDPLGSVFTREADYGPWGQTQGSSSLLPPKHQFLDQEPDPGLGTYQFGRRVYDPTLRRWLSPDPLLWAVPEMDAAVGEELNLYCYAANNPVRRIDPSGGQASDVRPWTPEEYRALLEAANGDVERQLSIMVENRQREELAAARPERSLGEKVWDKIMGALKVGPVSANFDGKGNIGGQAEVGPASYSADVQGRKEAGVRAGLVNASVNNQGHLSVGVGVGVGASAGIATGEVGVGVKATFKPTERQHPFALGSLEVSLSASGKLGAEAGGKAEAKVKQEITSWKEDVKLRSSDDMEKHFRDAQRAAQPEKQ